MSALVEVRALGMRLGGRDVLSGVDLDLMPGEIVTLVGPNGSGKTSLVRAIIGALEPGKGRIRRAPGLVIGYVPQRLSIDRTMPLSVDRFLALAGPSKRAARLAALARTGVAGQEQAQVTTLSGGQFQRVLLARALLRRPGLLALDEPTQGLDQPGTAQFYRLIEDVRAELGCAILMVSHDLHVVMSASDRVVCLNGHVCCAGTPTVVRSAPEYRALFGSGTAGALAYYRHEHDHPHDHPHEPGYRESHSHAGGDRGDRQHASADATGDGRDGHHGHRARNGHGHRDDHDHARGDYRQPDHRNERAHANGDDLDDARRDGHGHARAAVRQRVRDSVHGHAGKDDDSPARGGERKKDHRANSGGARGTGPELDRGTGRERDHGADSGRGPADVARHEHGDDHRHDHGPDHPHERARDPEAASGSQP